MNLLRFFHCTIILLLFGSFAPLAATQTEYKPYFSYSILQNGLSTPCFGVEVQRDRERFDVHVGYNLLNTKPSYHHTQISFFPGYNFYQTDEHEIYVKAGIKLTNTYCKKDPFFNSSRFLIFPQIGVGMKLSPHSNVEFFYNPGSLSQGKYYSHHSTSLRLIYHL